MIKKANNLNDLKDVANWVLNNLNSKKIILFNAKMGAGKTTFIKKLCETLGVEDPVSSPTYSIVNEYASKKGKIYHFDFYRLEDEEEAYDFGVEEYFDSGAYCFVEWPEKISNLLPLDDECVEVSIELDGLQRIFKIN